jgi:HAD superfamily hydrolase (TIGR01549 family)
MMNEVTSLAHLVHEKQYRNLIFDLDETLTRLDLPWQEWIKKVTASLPADAAKKLKQLLEIEGAPWGEVINEQIVKDPDFYNQFIKISQDFESKYFAHTPYDDLVNILPELKKEGCDLFLWTSNTRQTAKQALTEMDILHLFTQLLTREDVQLGKPHAEGWQRFTFSGQDRAACLMIGDSQNDALAAKAGGVDYYKISFFK